jgi:hypothetical protein
MAARIVRHDGWSRASVASKFLADNRKTITASVADNGRLPASRSSCSTASNKRRDVDATLSADMRFRDDIDGGTKPLHRNRSDRHAAERA